MCGRPAWTSASSATASIRLLASPSYGITRDPVHVHDLNATIMRLFGIDYTKLTFRFQGHDFRLTHIHGQVVNVIIS